MKPRRNRVRVMKWMGLLVCIFCVVAFVTSLRISPVARTSRLSIGIYGGCFFFMLMRNVTITPTVECRPPENLEWLPKKLSNASNDTFLLVPFWMILVIVAIPTFILWRRDRRYPEGCCQGCGYDLTGNESGVCSECGTEAEVV